MKLIKLLEELSDKDQIIQLIKKECQPWLTEIRDREFLRGISNTHSGQTDYNNLLIKKVHKDNREPSHSSKNVHKYLNIEFTKKFGHPFRNSLHATQEFLSAEHYGQVHVVFPIGNYEYLWSPHVHDIYVDLKNQYSRKEFNEIQNGEHEDKIIEYAKRAATKMGYTQSNIKSNTNNEVMIWCDKYYAIEHDYFEQNIAGNLI